MILHKTGMLIELFPRGSWVRNYEFVTTSCSKHSCQTLKQALTMPKGFVAAEVQVDHIAVNDTLSGAWPTLD
jgi:hypothetical protein